MEACICRIMFLLLVNSHADVCYICLYVNVYSACRTLFYDSLIRSTGATLQPKLAICCWCSNTIFQEKNELQKFWISLALCKPIDKALCFGHGCNLKRTGIRVQLYISTHCCRLSKNGIASRGLGFIVFCSVWSLFGCATFTHFKFCVYYYYYYYYHLCSI